MYVTALDGSTKDAVITSKFPHSMLQYQQEEFFSLKNNNHIFYYFHSPGCSILLPGARHAGLPGITEQFP